MILELTKQDILNLTNESKRKNNQPSREDDGHCTACMTGQRWKRNGGCRGLGTQGRLAAAPRRGDERNLLRQAAHHHHLGR